MAHCSGSPQKIRRCESCFINIFDDTEHICLPPNQRVSGLSTGVYVASPVTLFDFEAYGEMYHLNANNKNFELVGEKLLTPSTDGLILFEKNEGFVTARYKAASFKRLSFFVATRSSTSCVWSFVLTHLHGTAYNFINWIRSSCY